MKTTAFATAIALILTTTVFGDTTIFSDHFTAAPGAKYPVVNTNFWHIPSLNEGFYIGRTFLNTAPGDLPIVGNSTVNITIDSYSYSEGSWFDGTDLISNGPLFVGNGLTITARLKVDTIRRGTVFAFFLYSPPVSYSDTRHDEIDFEFMGNHPEGFYTNTYGNEVLGVGNPQFVKYSAGGNTSGYHTYQIVWLPNQVSWYVDGILARTVTNQSPIPKGPMYIHFNGWVPDSSWTDAYDSSFVFGKYQVWSMSVDSVSVSQVSPQVLTTIEIDPAGPLSYGANKQQQFLASAIDQNQNTIVTPIKLTWTSSNPAVAKISSTGLITTISPGTTNITASANGITSDPAALTVKSPINVVIQKTPALGTQGYASGIVNGIGADYKNWKIAVYINVFGGWWTKPTFAAPLTDIKKGGTWTAYMTTGGSDVDAEEVRAYLVPASINIPLSSGGGLPASLNGYLFDDVFRTGSGTSPVLKTITLSPTKFYLSLTSGTPQQLVPSAVDMERYPITAGVIWASSNPAIAYVDSDGRVWPKSVGKATITATATTNPKAVAKATAVVR